MTLYEQFANEEKLSVPNMLTVLNKIYNFVFESDEAHDAEMLVFESRMTLVESYSEDMYFERDVYKDKISGNLFMQKTYEGLYTEQMEHDAWVNVTCIEILVNKYIEVKPTTK